jgi:hypothetical protein
MKEKYLEIETKKQVAIIGDIHGCFIEFKNIVNRLKSEYGKNLLIVSVGDTIDRGDYNLETLKYTFSLFKEGNYLEVKSNHNDKLYRWFLGRNVTISYGLEKTINEIKSLPKEEFNKLREQYISYYENLPLYIIINKKVVVAHAGIKDKYIGRVDKKVKSFVLYGETTGKFTEEGFPERIDWTRYRKVNEKSPKIVYGHVVYEEPYINNLCYGIDTGCVLGNKLTAYLPFEEKFIFEKARKKYFSFD